MNTLTSHRTTRASRRLQFAPLACAVAFALGACSKSEPDTAAQTAAASAPLPPVAVASVPAAPVVVPAPTRTVVAQNDTTVVRRDERRVDHVREHDHDRALPPRSDRDDGNYVAREHDRDTQRVAAAACPNCGIVESIDTVKVQGQTNGTGAVAGGVGGAVIGNRIAGRNNQTLGGVVGAIGGGLIGNAIEKHERTSTAYDVHVRMEDGTLRTVRQTSQPAVGMKVLVEADGLHARS